MTPIQLALVAIRGLSVVLQNPILGGGSSLKLTQASELLGLLGEILERGKEGHAELKEFATMIEKMVEEGRSPTPAEWESLRNRSDAAHAAIQEAAAKASEPEPTPEPDPEPEPE